MSVFVSLRNPLGRKKQTVAIPFVHFIIQFVLNGVFGALFNKTKMDTMLYSWHRGKVYTCSRLFIHIISI